MTAYTVADTEADFRRNLGQEIMASCPAEAAARFCAIQKSYAGSVWIAEPGDPAGQSFQVIRRHQRPSLF